MAMPAMPTPPAGAVANLAIPARAEDGGYATINHAISAAEAAWHVRAGLNVAALGCRADEAAMAVRYNALLMRHKASLAAAYAAMQARFRAAGGDWQSAQDAYVTRLYNFFAQPSAKEAFCAAAAKVGTEAQAIAPTDFASQAPAALAVLEAPFTDFYRAYDAYRLDLAAWQARQAPAQSAAPLETAMLAAPAASTAASSPRLTIEPVSNVIDWGAPVPLRIAEAGAPR